MPALAQSPVLLPLGLPPDKPGRKAGVGSFWTAPHPVHQPAPLRVRAPEAAAGATNLDRLAHDARNVLAGLALYAELLAMPGVLNKQHGHYARELEGIVGSASRILEDVVQCAATEAAIPASPAAGNLPATAATQLPAVAVTDAARELRHAQPLLAAIAGPAIRLSIATMPCAGKTALAIEDFTRVLVNLVRNAADAMTTGGHIRITAQYGDGLSFFHAPDSGQANPPACVVLAVTDNGPGIPEPLRPNVFDLGFTTHKSTGWPAPRRRGLGLNTVRTLVESAGGSVSVSAAPTGGACFEIRLPLLEVTSDTYAMRSGTTFSADAQEKGCIECQ